LDDVKSAEEVGAELVAQVVIVLVLAGANDTVACAVDDDIHLAPVLDAFLQDTVDCFSHSDIAQQA
jgi:hypothetical protein